MNNEQKQLILIRISEIEQLDLSNIVAEVLADSPTVGTNIQTLTGDELVNLTKKCIMQLRDEIENGFDLLLPEQYNYHNEYGSGTLSGLLGTIKESFVAKNLTIAETEVKVLAYYEIVNNFFDKSARNIHSLRGIRVEETENKLNMMVDHFNTSLKKKEEIFKELKKKEGEVDTLISSKTTELAQITKNLNTANEQLNQINQLLNNSTANSTKIEGLSKESESLVTNANQKIKEESTLFNEFKNQKEEFEKNLKDLIVGFTKQDGEFTKKLEYVESKKEYFEERNNYLNELVEMQVGASLFETFQKRKRELIKTSWVWAAAVLLATIGLIYGIYEIFTGMPANTEWSELVARSLKAAPLAILLYFVIVHFNKERNFQEQYAFKSACALTIKAYSQLLNTDENKDNLILQAVSGVYSSPIKDSEDIKLPNKKIMEMIKEALDVAKNVTNK